MLPCIAALTLVLAAAGCQDPQPPQAAFAYASESAHPVDGTLRRVWANSRDYATPSPDGSLIAFVDWSTGDVAVHEVATGEDRRVTDKGTWEANGSWAEEPLFSPDGRRIVYSYGNVLTADPFRYELRMVELGDTTQRLVYALDAEDQWIAPMAWHPTAGILVELNRGDGVTLLGTVSPDDGSLRVVRRFEPGERHPHAGAISADGSVVVYGQGGELRSIGMDGSGDRALGVTGATLLGYGPDGGSVLFHADRSGTRGIWALRLDGGRPIGEPALVRDGIPYLLPGGQSSRGYFYTVPVEGPKIYMAAVDVERGGALMQPRQVTTAGDGWGRMPAWSPDGRSFAYALSQAPEDTRIMLSSPDGDRLREVAQVRRSNMESLFWSADGSALFYNAAGAKWPALYRLDIATGEETKLFEPAGRVVKPSRDGRSVVLSRHDGIYLRDLESGNERRLVEVEGGNDVALSPDGRTLVFTRRAGTGGMLVAVPVAGGEETVLLRLPEGQHVEGMGHTLAYTADGSRLLAVLGDSEGRHRLASIPAAGGEPTTLLELPARPEGPEKAHVRLHPDGRRIVYSTGYPRSEVWLLEF